MFKDYYKVLGISKQASAQEVKSAYRSMSMKWHPDKNPNADVTSIMQDINEAYAILKDESKRKRYDLEYDRFYECYSAEPLEPQNSESSYEYDYDIQDNDLKEDIAAAKQYAKELVNEFLQSFKEASHNAARGAWEGAFNYIIGGIIASIIFGLIRMCH